MDELKEKALLGWLGSLTELEPIDSLQSVDHGSCFINILSCMDSSLKPENLSCNKERVLATKKFLEEFYNTSFPDANLIDFNILLEAEHGTETKEETAKVLLLLLCAGIQNKNSDILSAAMKVDASLHWEVRQLIEAVLRPDEPTTALPPDFAKVFVEHTVPEMINSPLRLRIASLNMNDSLQITSPLRASDSEMPVTPLEELVNSPQLARKIMWREKEHRFKVERQLKEKEEGLKKCQQDLRACKHQCDELELDIQESTTQLHRKDGRIRELEGQVERLRALQDQLNELGAMQESNIELERDVESLRSVAQMADLMKRYCQTLREENNSLYDDISSLRDKVNVLEASQLENSKLQQKNKKLLLCVGELEEKVEAARAVQEKAVEEKRGLENDMDILRKVNQQLRQQLLDRSVSGVTFTCADVSGTAGESMVVVTDKLVEELRMELEVLHNTWSSPEVHQATLQELETLRSTWILPETHQTTLQELKTLRNTWISPEAHQTTLQELVMMRNTWISPETHQASLHELETLRNTWVSPEAHQTTLQELEAMRNTWISPEAQQTILQELEALRNTWTSPDSHQVTVQELEASQAAVKLLQEKCTSVRQQVQELTQALGENQTEVTFREEKCKALQQQLEEGRAEREQLQTSLDDLQSQQTSWLAQCDQLHAEMDSKQEQCDGLSLALQHSQQQCTALQNTIDDLHQQCDRFTSDLADRQRKLEQAEALENEKIQQFEDMVCKLESKGSECLQLVSEKLQVTEELVATKQSLKETVTLFEALQKKMTERDSDFKKLRTEKESESFALQSDIDSKNVNYDLVKKALEKSEGECAGLRSDLSMMSCALDKVKEELAEKVIAMREVQSAADDRQSQCHNLAENLAKKSSEIDQLYHRCEELERSLQDQEDKVTSLTADLSTSQHSHTQSQAEQGRVKQCLERQDEEMSKDWTASLLDKEDRIQSLISQLQDSQQQISQLESRLAATTDILLTSQASEQQMQEQIQSLQTRVESTEAALTQAQTQSSQISDTETLHPESRHRESALQNTVTKQRLQVEELYAKLEDVQNSLQQKDKHLKLLQSSSVLQIGQTHQLENVHNCSITQENKLASNPDTQPDTSHNLQQLLSEVQMLRDALSKKESEIGACKIDMAEKLTAAQEEIQRLKCVERKDKVIASQPTQWYGRDSELCTTVNEVISIVQTMSVNQVSAEQISQLTNSLHSLLQQTKMSKNSARPKEQDLYVRTKAAESHSCQLQPTVSALSQEHCHLQLHPNPQEAETLRKIQEENEKRLQSMSSQLEALAAQKRAAEAQTEENEEYWKLQLKYLQDEMEVDMKQQRETYENELAEQRAEYDTRLNSVLEEQEGLRMGQKAILEAKVLSLQETVTAAKTQFSHILEKKEAEFQQKLQGHEAETEKQLASLKHCLQEETETQDSIRQQMKQDRAKIHQLETELSERCQELEELLEAEQQDKAEMVARVVRESQDQLSALQCTLDQEREQSLKHVTDLQADTALIKEELTLSVQRTETLQKQLSALESQRDSTVGQLEREVAKQITMVQCAEDHNTKLQAQIQELEKVMNEHKSELSTLRAALHQNKGQREGSQDRDLHRKEMAALQQSHEAQQRQLSERVTSLQAQCSALQAENKTVQERAAESTKVMAEQLKRYERKCQQSETHRTGLEERLSTYSEKETQWRTDAEKLKELSQRLEELESANLHRERLDTISRTGSRESVSSQRSLRSCGQVDLDGSFTRTLPQTPGGAERDMRGMGSHRDSEASSRYSTYSTSSTKSVVFVPTGAGRMFSCEDEPESPKFEWGRLNELQRRNTLCLPHMKSSYPVETQNVKDKQIHDITAQKAKGSTVKGKSSSSTTSTTSSDTPGSRKRKPDKMDVDDDPSSHPEPCDGQNRKLARHGPMYHKPGPPTPLTERHRKLSDPQLATLKKKAVTPRRSPRRSARVRATPGGYANENVNPDSGPESVAFNVGFSPLRSSSRRLNRQKAFLSKSKLPQMSKPDDYDLPTPPAVSSTRTKGKPASTSSPFIPKGKRRPLAVRNCLHTQL